MADVEQDEELVCPACGLRHPPAERFCWHCGTPLVHGEGVAEEPLGELRRRARKIKPQYSEGAPVRVVGARNLTEADFIQGLLLEEGIPSMQRRARGFDVPDFLAAGPRDILVPASGERAAHEVLLQSELISAVAPARTAGMDPPWRVLAWLLGGLAILGLIVLLHP
jgi:hypothetical protein